MFQETVYLDSAQECSFLCNIILLPWSAPWERKGEQGRWGEHISPSKWSTSVHFLTVIKHPSPKIYRLCHLYIHEVNSYDFVPCSTVWDLCPRHRAILWHLLGVLESVPPECVLRLHGLRAQFHQMVLSILSPSEASRCAGFAWAFDQHIGNIPSLALINLLQRLPEPRETLYLPAEIQRAALCMIAQRCYQPKLPLIDEWLYHK